MKHSKTDVLLFCTSIISVALMINAFQIHRDLKNDNLQKLPIKQAPKQEVLIEGFRCYISDDKMIVDKKEYEITVTAKCSYNLLQSWFVAQGEGVPTGTEIIEPNGVIK